ARTPGGSSASTRTRPMRSRTPAISLVNACSPRSTRSGHRNAAAPNSRIELVQVSEAEVESARRDWQEGYRSLLEQTRESPARERLHAQVDAVLAELRRRVGGVFTVRELVAAYAEAERWSRSAVA